MSENAVLIFKWFGFACVAVPLMIFIIWKNMRSLNDIFDELAKLTPEQKNALGLSERHAFDFPGPQGGLGNNFKASYSHGNRSNRTTKQILYWGLPGAEFISKRARRSAQVFRASALISAAPLLGYFIWLEIDFIFFVLIGGWLIFDLISTPRWPRRFRVPS